MTISPPFPTFSLDDAPRAATLESLVAKARASDQVFELYPSAVFDNPTPHFADLWHLPDDAKGRNVFRPGPLTSAPVSLRTLPQALVHPQSGIVFDRTGRVLLETLQAEAYRDPTWARIAPLVRAAAKLAPELADQVVRPDSVPTTLFANHGGYSIFGHLMCETLPLALIFSAQLRGRRMKLLMPNVRSTALPDRLLDLVGLPPWVQTRSDKPFVWVNGLVVSSTCSAKATFNPGPMMHDMARTIKAAMPIARGGKRRVFLTRAGERTGQRRDLVNEAELIAALKPLGFEAVNPGLLPHGQSIALFANAECLVAMVGSVWSDLMFASPGTLVVDLLPTQKAAIGDSFGMNMAKLNALPYLAILCESHGPKPGDLTVTADIALIVDRITRGLERVQAMEFG